MTNTFADQAEFFGKWSDMANALGVEGRLGITFQIPIVITHKDGRVLKISVSYFSGENGLEVVDKDAQLARIANKAAQFFLG